MNDKKINFDRIDLNIQDAIVMMGPEGRVSFWNQNAQTMFGWTEEEALGKDLHQLIAPDRYHDQFAHGFEQFKRYGTGPAINKVLTLSAKHKTGHEFAIELTLGAISIRGEWFAMGMIRDMALKKRLEYQMVHAERLESLGTLAGGFAHEFNNILASIIGYTELALDDTPPGTLIHTNLKEVLTAGNRARDLVQHVLKFSRQTENLCEPVHMKTRIEETMKQVRASAPAAIDIRMDLQSDSLVMGDPARIHQMIINLCTNAAQAMPDGGTLTLALMDVKNPGQAHFSRNSKAPSDYLKFTISDTGMGMGTDILSRAFTPFFTTREQGEGVGMGLPVVHGIVSALNGWINPESEPGKGTTFDIFIPCIEKKDASTIVVSTPKTHGEGNILFVDDEEPILRLGRQVLERLGYKVEISSSSIDALGRFKASPEAFNLVITDLNMPSLNGLDMAEQMIHIRPDIPIILCTGYGVTMSDFKTRESGIRAIVYKPLLSDQIAEAIERLLTTRP